MATLAELNVVIGANIDEFERAMAELERGVGRAGQAAKAAGSALTQYVTLPLGLLAAASVKAAGDIQALEKGFAATYKGSEDLGTALAKVRELAKLPGLGLKEALQGATNLQAAGLSADLARRSLGAFGNALATVGRGKADLDGVGLALGQIAAKGKISAEEINQLAERVPQIREAMKAAFGTADTEALNKAGIKANEFIEGLVAQLEKLPKVSGGINNAFENLGDGVTIALAKVGTALNNAFDIEGKLNRLGDFIGGLADRFASLDPATQKAIFALGGVVAAAGPVVFAIGAIGAAVPAVVAGLEVLGLTSLAALGPVAAVAAGVAAAAYLIIDNWESISAYFTTGEGGRVFDDLAASVSRAVETIGGALGSLGGLFGDTAFSVGDIGKAFAAVFRSLGDGITAVLNLFTGVAQVVTGLFQGDMTKAANGFALALDGLTRPLRSLFGLLPTLATEAAGEVNNFLETGKMGSENWTKALTANLFTLGSITQAAKDAAAAAGGLAKQTGLLADLEAKLKTAKQQQTSATTEKDVAAANKLIESLEGQIKRLQELGVGSDEAAKALAKLRESLALTGELSQALGDDYGYVEARQSALESGVKSLIAAGWSPASKVVQGYVAELQRLNQALAATEQIQSRVAKGTEAPKVLGATEQLARQRDLPQLSLPPLNTNQFSDSVAKIPGTWLNLTSTIEGLDLPPLPPLPPFDATNLATSVQGVKDILIDLDSVIQNGFAGAIGSAAEAFGQVLATTGNIGDALAGAFKSILVAMADFAVSFGQLLVAQGSAVLLARSIAINPYGAIAAGAALIALGAAAGALLKKGPSFGGGGSAVPTVGGGGRNVAAGAPTVQAQKLNIKVEFGEAQIRMEGQQLRGLIAVSDYRLSLTS
ncbi:hypothetical protein GCM10027048_27690 [Hymenobacter coalescens]